MRDPHAPLPPEPRRRGPGLDPVARDRIGRGLRLLYAEVLAQPVPDALRALVASLPAPPRKEDTR